MEKKTFELLQEASKNPVNQSDYKSTVSNREQRASDGEKQQRLSYLLSQGLVSHTKDIYIINEYGYHVAQFKSWDDYLIHKKSLFDKKLQKEKYDLHISWFQSKTGWLPYLVSVVGLVFSVYAYNNSKDKTHNKESDQHHNTSNHKRIKDIDSSTKNTLNEKAVNKDTFHLKNLNNQ
ncbi:hypothetical protein [uncultured Algibacter sp.]|uniref:hypothetical protein n=1 Tax=uncultured Algibacter sp. TaxID=298659 RepID=UPI0026398916|nr:hypothetical protein [uncultured Algibacter sp.]